MKLMAKSGSTTGHAAVIAKKLGETEAGPRAHIQGVIDRWGIQFAYACMVRAVKLHANGGLLRTDGKGPRTLGGVFFAVVKERKRKRDATGVLAIFGPSPTPQKTAEKATEISELASKAAAQQQLAHHDLSALAEQKMGRPQPLATTAPVRSSEHSVVASRHSTQLARPKPGVRAARPATTRRAPPRMFAASSTYFDPEFVRR